MSVASATFVGLCFEKFNVISKDGRKEGRKENRETKRKQQKELAVCITESKIQDLIFVLYPCDQQCQHQASFKETSCLRRTFPPVNPVTCRCKWHGASSHHYTTQIIIIDDTETGTAIII